YNYLEENQDDYDIFVFVTYLYATTYFGIEKIRNPHKIFILPTYHNEPVAYLPAFQKYDKLLHLFLTHAEQEFAEKEIYKSQTSSKILGFGLPPSEGFKPLARRETYFLYAGRLEKGKGVLELFCMFEKYCKIHKDVYLYCIGQGELQDYKSEHIIYQGFVSEKQKYDLMEGAVAFLHPSAYESLGIVLLESFMVGTPAIVNGHSQVLREHIQNSCAGFYYWNEEEFFNFMDKTLFDKTLRKNFSQNARSYFLKFYSLLEYEKRLFVHF
ncbi:MAG: glycosyltransferase family 4 protein, partial [Leptospiraceae bacterium]|nr:glycosyltransferase family 4 protein [Leptospiraceae bacterium]